MNEGDIDPAYTMPTMIKGGIAAAHVRFDIVNAAPGYLRIGFWCIAVLQKGAGLPASAFLRVDPDPIARTDQGQEIIAAELPPALQI